MSLNVKKLPVSSYAANSYLVFDPVSRESALIDASPDLDSALEEIRRENLTVKYIFLTHGHFDHILTLQELREATSAPVIIHNGDADFLTDARKNLFLPFFGENVTFAPADVILSGGEEFYLGDSIIKVLSTPGHTEGSVVYISDDLMFTGDTLFVGSIGRSDLYGGNAVVLADTLDKLVSSDKDYIIYPGHGPKGNLFKERDTNPFIKFK